MFSFEKIIRLWLPALIGLAAVVVFVISPNIVGIEAAALLVGGGGGVVVVNYIQKHGFADVDREKEAESRAFLDRYGMWPGQAPPELVEQARRDGMLAHVTVRRRSGDASRPGDGPPAA